MQSKIIELKKFFSSEFSKIDKTLIKRSRKTNSAQLFAFLSKYLSVNCSKEKAIETLKLDGVLTASRQAVNKKLQLMDIDYFDNILANLQKHTVDKKIMDRSKIFAVDGTKLAINKKSNKFKPIGNGNYKQGLLNVIYSIDNNIPVGYDLTEEMGETKSFLSNLLKYVDKGDMVVFDRGYYSHNLINKLDKNGSYFLCRLKSNSKLVQYINDKKINDCYYLLKGYGIIRILKYTINDDHYYLATNQFDNNLKYFKELYHKRWSIEEFYKVVKCKMGLDKLNSKDILKIKQEISTQFILVTLAKIFEELSYKYVLKTKNLTRLINHSKTIFLLGDTIITSLFFGGRKPIKKIIYFVNIISKDRVSNKPNRHFKRTSIRSKSKWYLKDVMTQVGNISKCTNLLNNINKANII